MTGLPSADPTTAGAPAARFPPLVRRLLRFLDAGSLASGSRVLVLGSEAAAIAGGLRARGHEVREAGWRDGAPDLGALAAASVGGFDGAVAVGFLEYLRWDRWALQRVHRLLNDDGILLLAAPDLYSLRSLADPRYVAGKIAKLLPRTARDGTPRGREAVRSYSAGRLRAMLGRLGYEPLRWSGIGIRPSRGLAGGDVWPPTHHLVLARRRSLALGPTAMRQFEAQHRRFIRDRDDWCARQGLPGGSPRSLEPERFAGERVLVLAPHPDDEIIGCGGTLLRLVRAGAKVTVLQATDGSASAALEDAPSAIRRTIRLDEARAVAEAAGFEPTIFWREDNGAFRVRDDLVARLRGTLREMDPALVFTPFVTDIHGDHRTLNRILARALEGHAGGDLTVVGYEVWSLAPANLWCDVSSCMEEVERLLLLYQTAMKVDDFIHMCATRNRFHALTLGGAPGYAEVFFATEPARFREMVDRMPRGATPP